MTSCQESYMAGLIKRLNPASTLTKVLWTFLTELTFVKRTVDSPTIQRPGSTQNAGLMPFSSQAATKTGITAAAYSSGVGAASFSSPRWYGMPRPPPKSTNSNLTPSFVISAATFMMTPQAMPNGSTSKIWEPMWQCIPTGSTNSIESASR